MSELTEADGLRAYAAMLNTLDLSRLESMLADDFVYESQMVLQPLISKAVFVEYMAGKLRTLRRAHAKVYAEVAHVDEFGRKRACVVLAQDSPNNLSGLVFAQTTESKLARLDLCIVPPAETAVRTGEYPT